MTALPPALASLLGSSSLGLFHAQANGQFGFYYTLTRMTEKELPTNPLLESVPGCAAAGWRGHDVRRADEGLVFPRRVHAGRGARGRSDHRQQHSGTGDPTGAFSCVFDGRMTMRDVNEFIDGYAHEAAIKGTMTFGEFEGMKPASSPSTNRPAASIICG